MKCPLHRTVERHRTHPDQPDTPHASTSAEPLSAARPAAPKPGSPLSLAGATMPSILFNNFDRQFLDLREIATRGLILYAYPGCEESPAEGTDSLQADALQHRAYSALREQFSEMVPGGALLAVSSISPTLQFHQSPELAWDQDEDAPFQHYLVSDETLQLAGELGLPTFRHGEDTFYERLTLIARGGRIQRVFHPVRAGQDARQALTWLHLH